MQNSELILKALKTRHDLSEIRLNSGFVVGVWKGPNGADREARIKCGKLSDYEIQTENGNHVLRYRGHLVHTIGPVSV